MTMTFYPQREMSTRLLSLLPLEADENSNISSGKISIVKHELDENFDILTGTVSVPKR